MKNTLFAGIWFQSTKSVSGNIDTVSGTLLTHGRECVWSVDRGASCLNQSVEAPTVTARSPLVCSRDLRISNRISLGIKQSLMRTFKAPLGQAPGYTSECTSKNKTTVIFICVCLLYSELIKTKQLEHFAISVPQLRNLKNPHHQKLKQKAQKTLINKK